MTTSRSAVKCLIAPLLLISLSGCSAQTAALIGTQIARARAEARRPPADVAEPAAPALSREQQNLAAAHFLEGKRRFAAGEYAAAESEFTVALGILPQDAELLASRGWARANRGELTGARTDFYQAIRIDPDLAVAHVGLAEALKTTMTVARTRSELTNTYFAAKAAYGNAIRLLPGDPRLHYGRATTIYTYHSSPGSLSMGKVNELRSAQADLDHAVQLDPGFAEAYQVRALVRIELQDGFGASADAERAVALRPDDPEGYFIQGFVASHTRGRAAAPAYARRALELDPGNSRYRAAIERWERDANTPQLSVGDLIVGLFLIGALADATSDGTPAASPPDDFEQRRREASQQHQAQMNQIFQDATSNCPPRC